MNYVRDADAYSNQGKRKEASVMRTIDPIICMSRLK